MRYFIFKNRRNGKLVLDTDFSCHPPRQILCHYGHETPLIVTESTLEADMKFRNISTKTYNVVEIMLVDVKGVVL